MELNCFYEATGMGLFDYHADKERLDAGPFEWRVRTEPLPRAAIRLEKEWRDVLQSCATRAQKPTAPASTSSRRYTDAAWQQLIAAQDQELPLSASGKAKPVMKPSFPASTSNAPYLRSTAPEMQLYQNIHVKFTVNSKV